MDVYIAKLRKYLKEDSKLEIVNTRERIQAGCFWNKLSVN